MTAIPPLSRFETTVYKDKSGSDPAQVPASATIAFYAQGATVTSDASVPAHSVADDIFIDYIGSLTVGTIVSVGPGGPSLTVTAIASPSDIELTNYSGSNVSISAGTRLMPTSRPSIYSDQLGTIISGSSITTDSSTGRASCFVGARRFDYTVTIDSDVDFFLNVPGLTVGPAWNDVRDFANIQDAVDALPSSGGTVYIPAGTYNHSTTPAFTGLVLSKPVTILGDGGQEGVLSHLVHDVTNSNNIDAIAISISGGCVIKNLSIEWPDGLGSGTGRGVRWYKSGSSSHMAGLTLENLVVHRSPNLSFEFVCDGYDSNWVSKLLMIGCTAYEAQSGGSVLLGGAGSNNNAFEHCEFDGPGFGGYFDVPGCTLIANNPTITASDLSNVQVGDEVVGIGIAHGTVVTSLGTGTPRTSIGVSPAAIESSGSFPQTLGFYRASGTATYLLPRGCVHLLRASVSRFHVCSFQGPSTSPAVSTDLVSTDLELRDTYVERSAQSSQVHGFIVNGIANVLIDGLYFYSQTLASMLLKTGPSGLFMGRVTNVELVTNTDPLAGTDVVDLTNTSDELIIDHSVERSSLTGATRGILITGGKYRGNTGNNWVPIAVDLFGQTGAIATANLVASPPAGVYRLDWVIICTTAAAGTAAEVLTLPLGWTDEAGSNTEDQLGGGFGLSVTTRRSGSKVIRVSSGNVTYASTFHSGSGSPAYALLLRLTPLG